MMPWREVCTNFRMRRYLSTRDKYRTARGLDAQWEGCTTRLCGKVWNFLKTTLGGVAKATRLAFDKLMDGRNIAKYEGEDFVPCPLCDCEEDGQRHWVRECPALSSVRRSILREFDGAWGARAKALPKLYDFLIEYKNIIINDMNAERAWCGLFTEAHMQRLRPICDRMTKRTVRDASAAVKDLGVIMARGVHELWEERVSLLEDQDPETRADDDLNEGVHHGLEEERTNCGKMNRKKRKERNSCRKTASMRQLRMKYKGKNKLEQSGENEKNKGGNNAGNKRKGMSSGSKKGRQSNAERSNVASGSILRFFIRRQAAGRG